MRRRPKRPTTRSPGNTRIIHFATHAVASDSQPLYSTMILAPDAGAGHDGFLQAYEVLRHPLQAELVVLSGCETALGAQDWGQGLVGLVAAFQQAGARSVLATLWSIDESTAGFMTGFYRSDGTGEPGSGGSEESEARFPRPAREDRQCRDVARPPLLLGPLHPGAVGSDDFKWASPHFSPGFYCGGGSGHVYCVALGRIPRRTVKQPIPVARLVSMPVCAASLRNLVRNAG